MHMADQPLVLRHNHTKGHNKIPLASLGGCAAQYDTVRFQLLWHNASPKSSSLTVAVRGHEGTPPSRLEGTHSLESSSNAPLPRLSLLITLQSKVKNQSQVLSYTPGRSDGTAFKQSNT